MATSHGRNPLELHESPMLALPALADDRVSRGAKVPTIPSQRGADDQAFHSEVRLCAFAGATRQERLPRQLRAFERGDFSKSAQCAPISAQRSENCYRPPNHVVLIQGGA